MQAFIVLGRLSILPIPEIFISRMYPRRPLITVSGERTNFWINSPVPQLYAASDTSAMHAYD